MTWEIRSAPCGVHTGNRIIASGGRSVMFQVSMVIFRMNDEQQLESEGSLPLASN